MTAKPFLFAVAVAAFGLHGAMAGDCVRVTDSWAKKFMTPNKTTGAISLGAVSLTSVVIELSDKSYRRSNGGSYWSAWSVDPFDPQKEAAASRMRAAQSNGVCERTGSEAVNGEMADIYSVTYGGGSTTQWISQASGLPLKMTGQKVLSDGKTFSVTRFVEYSDVQPPQMDDAAPQQTPGAPH